MALSDDKIKNLFALCHAHGWSNDFFKKYLKWRYRIDSTSYLSENNYTFLCQIIESTTPEVAMPEDVYMAK